MNSPFHNRTTTTLAALIIFTAVSMSACGDSDDDSPDSSTTAQELTCEAAQMEDDALLDVRLGEMGDPANWPMFPPDAVVASTYLRLQETEGSEQAFGEVMGPITDALMAPAPGLMGLSFMSSEGCNTVRTLSVWESEEAMMDFVLGQAHLAAMGRVAEVSRGGSITDDWTVSRIQQPRWDTVVAGFADHEGPVY
ncbi:MAG: antibiotic biosynthesis monooxygenase [Myxococcota bacterium]